MSIRITSTTPGFRRAGIAHPSGPTTYPDDQFSEAQLSQLNDEPRLVIECIEDDSPNEDIAQKGTVDNDRLEELVGYIWKMDRADESLWCQDKTPKASAYPVKTTFEERETAWNKFVASLEEVDA
jgi:hypothetical protein